MLNKTQIKVRGYHLDLFQHVNNARYLEFIEEGSLPGVQALKFGIDLN